MTPRRLRPAITAGIAALLAPVAAACGGSGVAHRFASGSTTTAPITTTTIATTTTTTSTGGPATTSAPSSTAPPSTATIGDYTGVEPSIISFSGDSGDIVTGITWETWTATSAEGSGQWGYDDCDPDCAEGTVTTYPTTISLSDPIGGQFTKLVEEESGPHGQVLTFTLPDRALGGAS